MAHGYTYTLWEDDGDDDALGREARGAKLAASEPGGHRVKVVYHQLSGLLSVFLWVIAGSNPHPAPNGLNPLHSNPASMTRSGREEQRYKMISVVKLAQLQDELDREPRTKEQFYRK